MTSVWWQEPTLEGGRVHIGRPEVHTFHHFIGSGPSHIALINIWLCLSFFLSLFLLSICLSWRFSTFYFSSSTQTIFKFTFESQEKMIRTATTLSQAINELRAARGNISSPQFYQLIHEQDARLPSVRLSLLNASEVEYILCLEPAKTNQGLDSFPTIAPPELLSEPQESQRGISLTSWSQKSRNDRRCFEERKKRWS